MTDAGSQGRASILLSVRHEEMLSFVGTWYVVRNSWVVTAHGFIVVLFGAVWVRVGVDAGASAGVWLSTAGWSAVLFLVLVPLHEGIHALGYLIAGARDIRFVLSLQHAYAGVIAHRHVVGARPFTWMLIAPFLILTAAGAIALAALPDMSFLIIGVLLLHSIGCIGDWTMLNVLWYHRDVPVYTFDDANEGMTYFVMVRGSEEGKEHA